MYFEWCITLNSFSKSRSQAKSFKIFDTYNSSFLYTHMRTYILYTHIYTHTFTLTIIPSNYKLSKWYFAAVILTFHNFMHHLFKNNRNGNLFTNNTSTNNIFPKIPISAATAGSARQRHTVSAQVCKVLISS